MNDQKPLSQDLEYPQLSQAVRNFSAERLYSMLTQLEPVLGGLYDGDPSSLSYMEPARISAQTQVAKLYLSALDQLGSLFRVNHEPVPDEPEEPMIPAAQVPLMIEAAVDSAVTAAVQQVRLELESQKAEQERISSDQARASLTSALARIRARS